MRFSALNKGNLSTYNKQGGWGLIEVLVSATILFAFLTLLAQVVSTSSISSEKAEVNARFRLIFPQIKELIRNQLKTSRSGEGVAPLADDVRFSWRIIEQQTSQVYIDEFSLMEGIQVGSASLYEIRLKLEYKHASEEFNYHEFYSQE